MTKDWLLRALHVLLGKLHHDAAGTYVMTHAERRLVEDLHNWHRRRTSRWGDLGAQLERERRRTEMALRERHG